MNEHIEQETSRRRTFAIISHPDAGKTTLTEKLLLYGGALELAGSVTAKKKQRETASDWMELEKKRGISISSTVLQFDYLEYRLNLLDTPGHRDFSEDTYRVLMAVDAVIMVIDAAKGIENQTLKLFEICRKREIPIITFMNKLDRPALPALELIEQLEKVLNLHACPVNWPLGNGLEFKGVYDRLNREVHLFERVPGGSYRAPVSVHDLSDPRVKGVLYEKTYLQVMEELQLLDMENSRLERDSVLQGKTTPVFFGSASNNFGVEFLLKAFLEYSPKPLPRKTQNGPIPLDHPAFSAFIFKVQTNMNPLHRDRVIFARVCSGRYSPELTLYDSRAGKKIRLPSPCNLFGREREVVDEAYPGDIIGFVTRLGLRVGDTSSVDPAIIYEEIPRFSPECFAFIENSAFSADKLYRKGLKHLLAEDIVQAFSLQGSRRSSPLMGAVGPLQFEVMQYRMKEEYGAETRLDVMPWKVLRWVESSLNDVELEKSLPNSAIFAVDDRARRVVLFADLWSLRYYSEKNPGVKLFDTPPR